MTCQILRILLLFDMLTRESGQVQAHLLAHVYDFQDFLATHEMLEARIHTFSLQEFIIFLFEKPTKFKK